MEKVSIIIPVYNVEHYLHQCVDSLTAQSYKNLEIILVDDGSTDQSGGICDGYAASDARVRVIHQVNAGAANAKNAGLDHATGDYITFLDSDDYVEPDWIERLVSAAQEHHADVVQCCFDKVFTDHTEPGHAYPGECTLFTAEEYLAQYPENWISSLFWNKLFRSTLVQPVRFRKERRCIDDEFFTYKAVTPAARIVWIPHVLYHYRQRASGAVSSARNRKQITDDALEILIERYEWMRRYFPRIAGIYLKHDVDIMFYFARDFDYTEETVRKFRKTARYYLCRCLLHFPGRITLQYALMLQLVTKKSLLAGKADPKTHSTDGLFP